MILYSLKLKIRAEHLFIIVESPRISLHDFGVSERLIDRFLLSHNISGLDQFCNFFRARFLHFTYGR